MVEQEFSAVLSQTTSILMSPVDGSAFVEAGAPAEKF